MMLALMVDFCMIGGTFAVALALWRLGSILEARQQDAETPR